MVDLGFSDFLVTNETNEAIVNVSTFYSELKKNVTIRTHFTPNLTCDGDLF